jgi:hypothetical protein
MSEAMKKMYEKLLGDMLRAGIDGCVELLDQLALDKFVELLMELEKLR